MSRSGNPWAKQTVAEKERLCVSGVGGEGGVGDPSGAPTRPLLSPQGGCKPSAPRSYDQGTLIPSVFQTVAGLGAGSREPGPCQPRKAGRANPAATRCAAAAALGEAAPGTQQALPKCLPNCRAPEPTPPPGEGGPGLPLRSVGPPPHVPPSAGRWHRDPAPGAAEPHLRGSRTRRRTRSCRPCPPTWARGSWACGAPAARRCLLQPSSCCRCRPACRTGRPGAAWPRRAPEPSRAEPERWVGPRRRRAARATRAEPGRAARAGRGAGAGTGGPGLGGAGGTLLFLIQWRIAGPAAASGGAPGSASRSAPGRGRWRGTLRPGRARGGGGGPARGMGAGAGSGGRPEGTAAGFPSRNQKVAKGQLRNS